MATVTMITTQAIVDRNKRYAPSQDIDEVRVYSLGSSTSSLTECVDLHVWRWRLQPKYRRVPSTVLPE